MIDTWRVAGGIEMSWLWTALKPTRYRHAWELELLGQLLLKYAWTGTVLYPYTRCATIPRTRCYSSFIELLHLSRYSYTVRPINSDRKFLFFSPCSSLRSYSASSGQIDNEREENQTKKTLNLAPSSWFERLFKNLHFLTRINAEQILGQLSSDNRITLLIIVSRSIPTTRLIVSSCKLHSPICRFVA